MGSIQTQPIPGLDLLKPVQLVDIFSGCSATAPLAKSSPSSGAEAQHSGKPDGHDLIWSNVRQTSLIDRSHSPASLSNHCTPFNSLHTRNVGHFFEHHLHIKWTLTLNLDQPMNPNNIYLLALNDLGTSHQNSNCWSNMSDLAHMFIDN